eukprot:TRINITY_DN82470_c0_g1_i1.p1 TRINITY_DN82470_c0_g1~~TRINITY_DN82470_c0_g1_i1.p1  ORF type:complete len:352 (-),score=57.33 TRINITY_DN82470_c0_g1_i1:203-1258(-)
MVPIRTVLAPEDAQKVLQEAIASYSTTCEQVIEAHTQRAAALASAGCANAASGVEAEIGTLKDCLATNGTQISDMFSSVTFEQIEGPAPGEGQGQTSVQQIMESLLRDWSDNQTHIRDKVYEPVCARVGRVLSNLPNKEEARVWVPCSRTCRVAMDLLLSQNCHIVATDESPALLAAFVGLLAREGRLGTQIFPCASSLSPSIDGAAGRIRDEAIDMPGKMRNLMKNDQSVGSKLVLQHSSFENYPAGEGEFDCIVTVFTLQQTVDLPAAVKKLSKSLKKGGIWVNYGPLHTDHGREKRSFTFEDVDAFANTEAFQVLEDERYEHVEFTPVEVCPGSRDAHDVQLLVARKK